MRMRLSRWAGLTCLVISGCGALPEHYIPRTVGPKNDAVVDAGLRLEIRAARDRAPMGDQILFHVTFANQGPRPFLLPEEPQLLFVWTYPNGDRDNFLLDQPAARYYRADEVARLEPGERLTRAIRIETYYFDHEGVTEFRAVTHFDPNTNPALAGFWDGKAVSNSYGVQVARDGESFPSMDASTLVSLTR